MKGKLFKNWTYVFETDPGQGDCANWLFKFKYQNAFSISEMYFWF